MWLVRARRGWGVATLLLDLGKAYLAVRIAEYLGKSHNLARPYDLAVAAGGVRDPGACVSGLAGVSWRQGRGECVGGFSGSDVALRRLDLLRVPDRALADEVCLAGIDRGIRGAPLFALYFVHQRSPIVIAGFLFIPLLLIVKHHQNIGRLLAGTEHRFGETKPKVTV